MLIGLKEKVVWLRETTWIQPRGSQVRVGYKFRNVRFPLDLGFAVTLSNLILTTIIIYDRIIIFLRGDDACACE